MDGPPPVTAKAETEEEKPIKNTALDLKESDAASEKAESVMSRGLDVEVEKSNILQVHTSSMSSITVHLRDWNHLFNHSSGERLESPRCRCKGCV